KPIAKKVVTTYAITVRATLRTHNKHSDHRAARVRGCASASAMRPAPQPAESLRKPPNNGTGPGDHCGAQLVLPSKVNFGNCSFATTVTRAHMPWWPNPQNSWHGMR